MDNSFFQTLGNQIKTFVTSEAIWRGQLVSALVAGTGMFATVLSDQNPTANFPLLMLFFNYLFVAFYIFIAYYWNDNCPHHDYKKILYDRQLENPLWMYGLAAFLDVEANFFVTIAYNYTSITSIMLLDCFTIPCVILLSKIFLSAKYTYTHYIGTMLSLSGLAVIIAVDASNSSHFDNALLGDIFVMIGATFYACSNVLQEGIVKSGGTEREEYLLIMPILGCFLALIQGMIIDYPAMRLVTWSSLVFGCITGFVVCLSMFYIQTSLVLKAADSALFNLSLLSSDVYAVIFSWLITGHLVSWLYFLAFGLVAAGIWVYHSAPNPTPPDEVAGLRIRSASDVKNSTHSTFNTATTITSSNDYNNNNSSSSGISRPLSGTSNPLYSEVDDREADDADMDNSV